MTSAKFDSIKTGTERRRGQRAGGVTGIWESGVQAFHACTVTSSWEPCHHPGRVKAAFTKQGLRASDRPPLSTSSVLRPDAPASASSVTLFEWLAPTHWKFATQMHGLYLGRASLP